MTQNATVTTPPADALHVQQVDSDRPLTSWTATEINAALAGLYEHTCDMPVNANGVQTVEGHAHDRDGVDSRRVGRTCGITWPHVPEYVSTLTAEGDWTNVGDLIPWFVYDDGGVATETQVTEASAAFWWNRNLGNVHIPIYFEYKPSVGSYAYLAVRLYAGATCIAGASTWKTNTSGSETVDLNFSDISPSGLTFALGKITAAFPASTILRGQLINGQKITMRGATNAANDGTYAINSVNYDGTGNYITDVVWDNASGVTEAGTPAVIERIADDADSTGWLTARLMAWVDNGSMPSEESIIGDGGNVYATDGAEWGALVV